MIAAKSFPMGEIEDAIWFAPSELPERIPGPHSVARALIEWFKSSFTDEVIVKV